MLIQLELHYTMIQIPSSAGVTKSNWSWLLGVSCVAEMSHYWGLFDYAQNIMYYPFLIRMLCLCFCHNFFLLRRPLYEWVAVFYWLVLPRYLLVGTYKDIQFENASNLIHCIPAGQSVHETRQERIRQSKSECKISAAEIFVGSAQAKFHN